MTPKVETKAGPRARPIVTKWSWHRLRKRVHVICFVIFVLLPFFDLMRFDIPRQRFYFLGFELWISEFSILFFSLMFLMFVITALAMLYGRVYCSYLCPQMIFSEAFASLQQRIDKIVKKKLIKWSKRAREVLSRVVFYAVLLLGSIFLAFVFISYFVEPRDLIQRLFAMDLVTAGGLAGAVTTAIIFLDLAFVRLKFCTTVCPYGYLQGILSDGTTLLVEYSDGESDCIECKKCVRVCPMGIDIRDGAHQIECVHCAECVDACEDVLNKLGKSTLVSYSWGENTGPSTATDLRWYHRLGLRDKKRWVVLLVLMFYASGLLVALSMRNPVLVRLAPQRDVLYEIGEDGDIYNEFRVRIANRSPEQAYVTITIEDLPQARLVLEKMPIVVEPGSAVDKSFRVAVDPLGPSPGVNHFSFLSTSMPAESREEFPMTFIMPVKEEAR